MSEQLDESPALDDEEQQDEDANKAGKEIESVVQLAVLVREHLPLQSQAVVVHSQVQVGHHVAVRHTCERVEDVLVECHVLVGFLIVAHAVVDECFPLSASIGREPVGEAQCLLVVAVDDVVVHLGEEVQRPDAVGLHQPLHLIVDAVELLDIVLLEGHDAHAVQSPALVVGSQVGLGQQLVGIFLSCFVVIAQVGQLHELAQVFSSALFGEVLVAVAQCFLEVLLGGFIVILLHVDGSLRVQGKILARNASLGNGMFGDFFGYFLGLLVILVSGFIDGLLAPRLVEQSFVAGFPAGFLQLVRDDEERVSFAGADIFQHACLKFQKLVF